MLRRIGTLFESLFLGRHHKSAKEVLSRQHIQLNLLGSVLNPRKIRLPSDREVI